MGGWCCRLTLTQLLEQCFLATVLLLWSPTGRDSEGPGCSVPTGALTRSGGRRPDLAPAGSPPEWEWGGGGGGGLPTETSPTPLGSGGAASEPNPTTPPGARRPRFGGGRKGGVTTLLESPDCIPAVWHYTAPSGLWSATRNRT